MMKLTQYTSEPQSSIKYRYFQLHVAAANGYLEVADFLLDQHVAIDVTDDDMWQPIHAAACWSHVSPATAEQWKGDVVAD